LNLSLKDKVVCEYILQHCNKLEDAVQWFFDCDTFISSDSFHRDGVVFSLQQIGELVNEQLSKDFKLEFSEIPW